MRSASLELTNACPWRCRTCLPSSAVSRPGELSGEALIAVLSLLASEGFDTVYYTGGEPLTRKDLAAILTAGATLELRQSFVTSGSGLDVVTAELCARLGVQVYVSLDGATAAEHDAVRGDGSFGTAVAALRLLAGHGAPTGVSVTVNCQNVDSLGAITALACGLGARRLTFSEVVYGGRARSWWDSLGLSADDRLRMTQWFDTAALPQAGELAADDQCWVDGNSLYLTSDGRVYLCSEIFQSDARLARGKLSGGTDADADADVLRSALRLAYSTAACRYQVRVRGPFVLVVDSGRPCAVLALHGRAYASPAEPIQAKATLRGGAR